MKRNYGFDNIKAILIFFVVVGHLLEFCGAFPLLYRMIYLFHMPVFMFVSGYFAKFGARQLLDKIWMYGLFQTAYIFFERAVKPAETVLQYTTPYWILWYMFVMIFYTALIPLYHAKSREKRVVVLVCSVLLALGAGFIEKNGLYLSLSRFFVFQPYFLLGFYAKEQQVPSLGRNTFICTGVGAVLSLGIAWLPAVTSRMLYGSMHYTDVNGIWYRLLLLCSSVVWIGFFWAMKDRINRNIPLVTAIGSNTISIYLLHGFLMRMGAWGLLPIPQGIAGILLSSLLICLFLGNAVMGTAVSNLSPVKWFPKKK